MVYIPPEKIREIQDSIDIVQLISEYLPLKPAGKNYKAICPFHEEKTSSFLVSSEKQLFHCFGCKEGGNVFHFLIKMDSLTFPEASKILAERAGIPLEINSSSKGMYDLYEVNKLAMAFFQENLKHPHHQYGKDYLHQRKINLQSEKDFLLGLVPPGWDNFLSYSRKNHKIPVDLLVQSGLVISRSDQSGHYDRFRSRIIFPIQDGQKRVVGFGGRSIGEELPKYLNSPESPLFNKSHLLYGLSKAKDEIIAGGRVGIVEGYTDVIMCHQFGFSWIVATLGTAFTSHHAKLMKRYAKEVVLLFDGDEAGNKASLRSVSTLLEEELDVKIVTLDSGCDPCDFLLKFGKDAFEERVGEGLDFIDFFIQEFRKKGNLNSLAGKSEALKEILPTIQKIKNPIVQDDLIQRIGDSLSLNSQALYRKMEQMASRNFSKKREEKGMFVKSTPMKIKASKEETDIFQAMLKRPDLIPNVLEIFPPEKFLNETFKKIAIKWRDLLEEKESISSPLEVVFDPESLKWMTSMVMEGMESREKQYNLPLIQDCITLLRGKELQKKLDQITVLRKKALEIKNFEELRELTREYTDLIFEQKKLKLVIPGKRLK